ncbi:MAG: type II secretion system protein [Deltaproteobacteria bacterium]|nr:type II secretion system protein [Deltaproteobacteria bacterium]
MVHTFNFSKAVRRGDQGGFTYLSLLFLIVVMGIALSVAGELWTTTVKREREEDLLFRGNEIRRAIGRYYEEGPGIKQFPREFKDLIKDSRFPATRRHLRKLYADPFTGKADWEVIKNTDGTIKGVKSTSNDAPIKTANFHADLETFAGKSKYSEWEFAYSPEKKDQVRRLYGEVPPEQ